MSGYELVPGTSLPMTNPGGEQHEGRDYININRERAPVSLFQKIEDPAFLTAAERAFAQAAIRAFDTRRRLERTMFIPTAGETDATTGNLVLQLFECPAGLEAQLTSLTVDFPNSSSVTPSAPVANAAIFMFVSVLPAQTRPNSEATANSTRRGMVTFAPTSAAGPVIPGQWTFGDGSAPIAFGGQAFHFVLVGGSQSAVTGQAVMTRARVNLYSRTGYANPTA